MSCPRPVVPTSVALTFFLLVAMQCSFVASIGLSEWLRSWIADISAPRAVASSASSASSEPVFIDPLRVYTLMECQDIAASTTFMNATVMCDVLMTRQNNAREMWLENRRLRTQLSDERAERAGPEIGQQFRNISGELRGMRDELTECNAGIAKCTQTVKQIEQNILAELETKQLATFKWLKTQASQQAAIIEKLQRELEASIELNGQSYITPSVYASIVWSGISTIVSVMVFRGYEKRGRADVCLTVGYFALHLCEMLGTMSSAGVFWFPLAVITSIALTSMSLICVQRDANDTRANNQIISRLAETFVSTIRSAAKSPTTTTGSASLPAFSETSSSSSFPEIEGSPQQQQPGLVFQPGPSTLKKSKDGDESNFDETEWNSRVQAWESKVALERTQRSM